MEISLWEGNPPAEVQAPDPGAEDVGTSVQRALKGVAGADSWKNVLTQGFARVGHTMQSHGLQPWGLRLGNLLLRVLLPS